MKLSVVMMNRLILLVFLITQCGYCLAQPALNERLQFITANDTLSRAQWGIFAQYVDDGTVLLEYNHDYPLAPASGLKALTTGLALHTLGPDFRFETDLYLDGKISRSGVLNGNILIRGGGDPTLGSDLVPGSTGLDSLMRRWTNAVKARGIKKITGAVIADISLFDGQVLPDYWPWTDMGNYYGAATNSLCINDNLYYLTFKPGQVAGDPAQVLRCEPEIPGLKFENHMRTGPIGSGDNGYIYCAPRQYLATLRGTVPAGVDEFTIKGSIPDPALFAAQYLSGRLAAAGITVNGRANADSGPRNYDRLELVDRVSSPSLIAIINLVHQKSVNLYAEQLLKITAEVTSDTGSIDQGLKLLYAMFDSLGIERFGLELYDGSGLSRTNQISVRQFSAFLRAMADLPDFEQYLTSFSLAGDPAGIGFLKSFGSGTELAFNGRIKTGLINGARSHSGYLRTRSGRLVTFSMICNNYPVPTSRINRIHERLLIELAQLP
ncbi:MAG: D-alanyl-D-alanine carboxypeptidase/D-alanyl-D-alanine-endopeptidase [Candidatus Neomarinimicrobiota bacterium]